MSRNTKLVIAALLVFSTLVTTMCVIISFKTQSIKKNDIKVSFNNEQIELKDKDGTNLSPVKLGGKTYLPLEPITNMVKLGIEWDKDKEFISLKDTSNIHPNNDLKGKFTFLSFNNDSLPKISTLFEKAYPNIEMVCTYNLRESYDDGVEALIKSGSIDVPDVIAIESSFVKRFVNIPGGFADLTDLAKDYTKNMIPYTVQVGKDKNGALRALADSASPGAIAYKRKVAKKYLGTDDPEKISSMLSSKENMLQTASILKEKSGGKVALFGSIDELTRMWLGSRNQGWVINNKLTIDKAMMDYIDFGKILRDNKYDAGADMWSPDWTKYIGDNEKTLACICPSWGIPWIVGVNDKKSGEGDRWALAKPAFPYFWGGTWYGIYSKSQNKEAALEFIKFITTNKDYMKARYKEDQEFPNNLEVISDGTEDYNNIVDQDVFKFYEPFIKKINGKNETQFDDAINTKFNDSMKLFLTGKIKTKEEMLNHFKKTAKTNNKEIVVE